MRRFALVGPPNVGKSTLFFVLTGRYVRTANYPGTTLEVNSGRVRVGGVEVELVDLPGVSRVEGVLDEDERVAVNEVIYGRYDGVLVVAAPHAVAEALELARFVSRFKPVAVVFNMADVWTPPYSEEELSARLGVPVVYVSAARRRGVEKVLRILAEGLRGGVVGEVELSPPRWAAAVGGVVGRPAVAAAVLLAVGVLTAVVLMAVIEGVTPLGELPFSLAAALDEVDGYVRGVVAESAGGVVASFLADALWESAVVVATISMYVLLALALVVFYEDSGLVGVLAARAQSVLASVGLPPRGVVCLFSAVSCNVPAVGAARVLWGARNRVFTALLTPYMPCVARLSIFAAVAAAALVSAPFLIPVVVLAPYFVSLAAAMAASYVYRLWLRAPPLAAAGAVPPTPILLPSPRVYLLKLHVEFREFLRRVVPLLVVFIVALWPLKAFGPGGLVEDPGESYLALAGRYLEGAFSHMGWGWEVVAPLAAGWVFKEVVLGLLEATGGLDALAELPLPSVLAFLTFVAFYSACVATLTAVYRLVGLKLTLLSVAVNLTLAYVAANAVYAALSLLTYALGLGEA